MYGRQEEFPLKSSKTQELANVADACDEYSIRDKASDDYLVANSVSPKKTSGSNLEYQALAMKNVRPLVIFGFEFKKVTFFV